tara:strand:- start:2648 stop:3208 length:561 start_codon:yes stop_codon:yes gene_type:complete
MLFIDFHNLTEINTSLQVGDLIYARKTHLQLGAKDLQVGKFDSTNTGVSYLVGVLRAILYPNSVLNTNLRNPAKTGPQPGVPDPGDPIIPSKGVRLVVDNTMLSQKRKRLGTNQIDVYDDGTNGDVAVDDTTYSYIPKKDDFVMFSKYSQGDTGVLGYFAKAKLVNNSRQKAEIFAISSEITINSN